MSKIIITDSNVSKIALKKFDQSYICSDSRDYSNGAIFIKNTLNNTKMYDNESNDITLLFRSTKMNGELQYFINSVAKEWKARLTIWLVATTSTDFICNKTYTRHSNSVTSTFTSLDKFSIQVMYYACNYPIPDYTIKTIEFDRAKTDHTYLFDQAMNGNMFSLSEYVKHSDSTTIAQLQKAIYDYRDSQYDMQLVKYNGLTKEFIDSKYWEFDWIDAAYDLTYFIKRQFDGILRVVKNTSKNVTDSDFDEIISKLKSSIKTELTKNDIQQAKVSLNTRVSFNGSIMPYSTYVWLNNYDRRTDYFNTCLKRIFDICDIKATWPVIDDYFDTYSDLEVMERYILGRRQESVKNYRIGRVRYLRLLALYFNVETVIDDVNVRANVDKEQESNTVSLPVVIGILRKDPIDDVTAKKLKLPSRILNKVTDTPFYWLRVLKDLGKDQWGNSKEYVSQILDIDTDFINQPISVYPSIAYINIMKKIAPSLPSLEAYRRRLLENIIQGNRHECKPIRVLPIDFMEQTSNAYYTHSRK